MSYHGDVAVVGVGSIGSMAAWRLATAGLAVHGFEQHGLGHDRGAAGGESRRFATHGMGDSREVPLAIESQALWRTLESLTGRDLLTLNGGLVIGPPDAPGLTNAKKSAVTYQLPYEELNSSDIGARYPEHRVGSTTKGCSTRKRDSFVLSWRSSPASRRLARQALISTTTQSSSQSNPTQTASR